MGSKWSAYYPHEPGAYLHDDPDTIQPSIDTSEDPGAGEKSEPLAPVRARPSFSSASTRAANSAKAKLAEKSSIKERVIDQMSKSDR